MFHTPEASACKDSTCLGGALLEGHGDGVYAVARILLGETFAEEDMAKVAIARCTHYLGSRSVGIGVTIDGKRELLVKGWPSAIGVELVIGSVEGGTALGAVVGAHLLVVGIGACVGTLSALVDDHLAFLGIEFLQQGLVYGFELESFTASLWYVHRLYLGLLTF